jgi:hypothetical protein
MWQKGRDAGLVGVAAGSQGRTLRSHGLLESTCSLRTRHHRCIHMCSTLPLCALTNVCLGCAWPWPWPWRCSTEMHRSTLCSISFHEPPKCTRPQPPPRNLQHLRRRGLGAALQAAEQATPGSRSNLHGPKRGKIVMHARALDLSSVSLAGSLPL